ncbi:tetratricopeptide repeat protein [Aeromonas sp. 82P]|uniref:tetratricopeptide repeat protein n=1 Tax=Aeromonas sp. 82P TaxID=3452726 RepID=UPI003F79494E
MKKTMLAAILLTGFLHETARAEINIDQLLQRESRELEAYRKAAEQGDAKAQYNLGWMYGNGQGVELDFKQAYAWFSVAAVNGVGQAVEWRDRAASKLTPTALAEAQALASRYFDQSQPK